ncbi:MAG TPA: SUMF1/EgtB/PvdO family nonheme iron enzyme [bacterium]|nr:SUMF1/EgtB/PvdO family nonheme iron enzyme [bacterium]
MNFPILKFLPGSYSSELRASAAPLPPPANQAKREKIGDRDHLAAIRSARHPSSVSRGSWGTPWSYTPWALFSSLQGCSHHPPVDVDTTHSDGGKGEVDDGGVSDDGAAPDAGQGGASDAGDGGSPGAICQVKYPLAVLFYDCVDMADSGAEPTRVCLSERLFAGDVEATKDWIRRGLDLSMGMYARGCSPLAVEFVLMTPSRVLNAVVDSPEIEFNASSFEGLNYYLLKADLAPLEADIVASGEDPLRFAGYLVLNAWNNDLMAPDTPQTYPLSYRTNPPFALIHGHITNSYNVEKPGQLRSFLPHEFMHALLEVAQHHGFNGLIHPHEYSEYCPHLGGARWMCSLERDALGNPLRPQDWSNMLGALGSSVMCDDESFVQLCQPPSEPLACEGVTCPTLHGYSASCNEQGSCEYHRNSIAEPWQEYDRWIYVPAGASFMMGTDEEAPFHQASESPQHEVQFQEGYFIGKYEVPVEAHEACVAAGDCNSRLTGHWDTGGWGMNTSLSRPLHPANFLTWGGAMDVCNFIRPGARAPSMAEWEYAARGPLSLTYPHGNDAPLCSDQQAVFNESGSVSGFGCGAGGTYPVNAFLGISSIGAYHMAGNLWEWTEECWHPDYSADPGNENGLPINAPCESKYDMDLRGGGYNDGIQNLRGAARFQIHQGTRNANIGARCSLQHYWGY